MKPDSIFTRGRRPTDVAHRYRFLLALAACVVVVTLGPAFARHPERKINAKETSGEGPAVLWRDPVDITSRNLYYGPGGKAHEPSGTFTFEKEDRGGSNPKFDVIDQNGVKWGAKLDEEARPETVASRLVWAVGYFANEDYFIPVLQVRNMPRLHRGSHFVSSDGSVRDVRMKRHLKDQKKIGTWSWSKNPFTGTRELYGLRVLMAVISNWDLKDSNTAIFQIRGDQPEQRYLVSDLGSSFGLPGLTWGSKGGLKEYAHSKLIDKVASQSVDFNVPGPPKVYTFFNAPEMARRFNLRWLGQDIPLPDAKWMGQLLARLSPEQIRDAFRAAGYSPEEVEGYTQVLQRRIAALKGI